MPLTISKDDVRYRARPLTNAELSDTLLFTAAYIPAAVAQVEQMLASANLNYDVLSASQQNLAKALATVICCRTIAVSMPTRGFRGGVIEFEPMSSADKDVVAKQLDEEIAKLCNALGIPRGKVAIGSAGSHDYEVSDAGT